MPLLPLGPWRPDRPPQGNPGLIDATGALPGHDWRPWPRPAEASGPLPDGRRPLAAVGFTEPDGTVRVYAASPDALHQLGGALLALHTDGTGFTDSEGYLSTNLGWTDVSKAGGYNAAEDGAADFVPWEAGSLVLMTNGVDPIQQIPAGGVAADLGDPAEVPRARTMTICGPHLLLGHTTDPIDGTVPHRVWFSGRGDPALFPTPGTSAALNAGSDFQDLIDGGPVQRVFGWGEYAVVLQKNALTRLALVGATEIFTVAILDAETGTDVPGAACRYGRAVFYYSQEGFRLFDGAESRPIGEGRVDRWFADRFDGSRFWRVSAAPWPAREVVIWSFPERGQTEGEPQHLLAYHWPTGEWGHAENVQVDTVFRALTPGFTLEQLDVYGSLENLPASLDSPIWNGGEPMFAAFSRRQPGDDRHSLAYFTGEALPAVFDLAEFQPIPNRLARLYGVRPVVEAAADAAPAVSMGLRDRADAAPRWVGPYPVSARYGTARFRHSARYVRYRLAIAGDYEAAQALDVEDGWIAPGGRR